MPACGLDFGTSNTAIALPDGTVLPVSPGYSDPRLYRSVIFFPEDDKEVYTGAPAISRYLEDPFGRFIQSVKSFLHSRSFRATQVHSRTWTIEAADLKDWLGNRAEAGRLPMKGFPKNNKFG